MAFRTFTVKKWKKLANTANGNPVYSFELESAGHTVKGKTKPNAGFVFGIPSVYPGDKINVELSATPSGRVYMTDFARSNPTTRKTAARTQRAAESYVRRPSQITKKAPSKRLKKRRTVNLQSPRGVFPNPAPPKYRVMSFSGKKIIGYTNNYSEAVTMARAGRGRWIAGIDKQGGSYFKVKNNPDSVHFDIDVNSHNARGRRAKTRTNPAPKKATKYFIATDHKEGVLYFDGVGFSKLKSSAVDFRNEENVTKRAIQLADHFRRAMKVLAE